jgi:nucleoside-diphosphate-sugar epimerase
LNRAAIFGAAGAIGRNLAPELERRGVPFRVVGRSRSKLEAAFGGVRGAEIFPADIAVPEQAAAAARGVDTVIYAAGLPYPDHRLHPVLMRAALDAAVSEGTARLLLVSSVYPYGVPRTARVAETHPREPESRKGRYRAQQEDLAFAAHRDGRLATLVLRLPDFYGPHAELGLAELIFEAALAGKTATWLGPAGTPHEFVFMPDTGPVIADLASAADCYGEAWNFGGPGGISGIDFITRVYRAAGRAPKYRSVGRGPLKLMGWFSAFYRELPEMLYLQETPVLLDDSKLFRRFPATRKTGYDEGIRRTLESMRSAAKV